MKVEIVCMKAHLQLRRMDASLVASVVLTCAPFKGVSIVSFI